MPDAEIFSFVFNTLLSDVAARCPEHRDSVIEAQVGLQISVQHCPVVPFFSKSYLIQYSNKDHRICSFRSGCWRLSWAWLRRASARRGHSRRTTGCRCALGRSPSCWVCAAPSAGSTDARIPSSRTYSRPRSAAVARPEIPRRPTSRTRWAVSSSFFALP